MRVRAFPGACFGCAALCGIAAASSPVWAALPAEADQQRQTFRLNAAQMFKLAEAASQKGDGETELAIFRALESNPDADIRAEARYRHAKRMIAMKRYREAAILLRRVLDEKPAATAARLELARTLQLLGDTNGALRQLRAAQSAGLPPQVARLIDRYSAALRAQRPSGASFEIALAPDSNINRATRSGTLGTVLGDFEIADEGKATSGVGLSLSGQAFRRFKVASDATLLVRASGLANLYRRSRFNDIAADIAAGPEFAWRRDRLQLEVGATQRWFGQRQYMRSARVGATLSHSIGSRTLLRLTSSAARIDNQLNDLQDGHSFSGQVQVERALSPSTGVAGSLSLDREALKDPGYSTRGWRTGVTAWRDIGRVTITAGAEFGRLHADERLLLFPARRSDRYSRLSFGASFRQLQYAGFAPVLRFSIERNRSTIAFYDYRRTRSEMAIVRAF